MNCSNCAEKQQPEGSFYHDKQDITLRIQHKVFGIPIKFSTGFKLYIYICPKCGRVALKLFHNEYGRAGSIEFTMPMYRKAE